MLSFVCEVAGLIIYIIRKNDATKFPNVFSMTWQKNIYRTHDKQCNTSTSIRTLYYYILQYRYISFAQLDASMDFCSISTKYSVVSYEIRYIIRVQDY